MLHYEIIGTGTRTNRTNWSLVTLHHRSRPLLIASEHAAITSRKLRPAGCQPEITSHKTIPRAESLQIVPFLITARKSLTQLFAEEGPLSETNDRHNNVSGSKTKSPLCARSKTKLCAVQKEIAPKSTRRRPPVSDLRVSTDVGSDVLDFCRTGHSL